MAPRSRVVTRGLILLFLACACAQQAQAGPISTAIGSLETALLDILSKAATVIGPVCQLVGGGRAAYLGYKGEEWVWPFITALVGTAIWLVAV